MADPELVQWSYELKEKLLADAWGGWRSLDRTFLERMCERMVDLMYGLVETDHSDCVAAEDYENIEGEYQKALETVAAVEDRERKLLMGRVSALGCVRV